MKRLYMVSYMYYKNSYSNVVSNVISVLTALSEEEALGKAYKTAKKEYPKNTVIAVMNIPDEHVRYAYSQLEENNKNVKVNTNA